MGCFYSDSRSAASYACICRVLVCPQFDVCVRSCSTSSVSPTQACTVHAPAPLSIRFLILGISTRGHNNRCSRRGHSRALLMYVILPNELYQHYQDRYPRPIILPHSRSVSRSAPDSHQDPEASKCVWMEIEPLYPPQFAHKLYLFGYHHPCV